MFLVCANILRSILHVHVGHMESIRSDISIPYCPAVEREIAIHRRVFFLWHVESNNFGADNYGGDGRMHIYIYKCDLSHPICLYHS